MIGGQRQRLVGVSKERRDRKILRRIVETLVETRKIGLMKRLVERRNMN